MGCCYFCRNCRRKTHTDAEVGPMESFATFWCVRDQKPVYLPRESGYEAGFIRREHEKERLNHE